MRIAYILFLFIFVTACSHKLPMTTDFILFERTKSKLNSTLNTNLDLRLKEEKLGNVIYMSGIRWEDRNFEGIKYQLPVICDNFDLELFLEGKEMRVNKVEQTSKTKIMTQGRKTSKDKMETSRPVISKLETKMAQYSFLYFIDQCRVVFVSNTHVKYGKNYSPIIKNEFEELELNNSLAKRNYIRGYYLNTQDSLIVELRSSTSEPSSILYFVKDKKDGDLQLEKVITYKLKKDYNSNTDNLTINQIVDKEIYLLDNFPDILNQPRAYKIPKSIKLKFKQENVDDIQYELTTNSNPNSGLNSNSKLIRKYILGDSVRVEFLDRDKCLSW